jgi:hypothetical protein
MTIPRLFVPLLLFAAVSNSGAQTSTAQPTSGDGGASRSFEVGPGTHTFEAAMK